MLLSHTSPLFIAKRWQHHTASGGYDRLAQELGGRVVRRRERTDYGSRLAGLVWRKMSFPRPYRYLLDYGYEDWLAEWRLLAGARLRRPKIVHCLYGDEQLNVLLRQRWLLPCPLVATFHLPTYRDIVKARFERLQKHLMTRIDAAIVVARSQLPDFQRWLGSDRVIYIPHGIDTKRFCPADRNLNSPTLRLVTVGDHMRDWDALHRIIDECWTLRLPVEFDVVVHERVFPFFTGCRNVRLHTNVPEEQLISLYRAADALLLPIEDATANNAVLESMACGTPVISTAVGGIPDYVDETAGWLFRKGEQEQIVNLIKCFCNDRNLILSRRLGARAKSLEFDWQRICVQVNSVYEALCNGIPIQSRSYTALPAGRTKLETYDA
jgi:glycosyltransferase involved in cell wall biosynthesis